jgi:hypothetical protein
MYISPDNIHAFIYVLIPNPSLSRSFPCRTHNRLYDNRLLSFSLESAELLRKCPTSILHLEEPCGGIAKSVVGAKKNLLNLRAYTGRTLDALSAGNRTYHSPTWGKFAGRSRSAWRSYSRASARDKRGDAKSTHRASATRLSRCIIETKNVSRSLFERDLKMAVRRHQFGPPLLLLDVLREALALGFTLLRPIGLRALHVLQV